MLQEMMNERGLKLAHTTIKRWVHQYSSIMDETYLKIKGKNAYLYRAVDSEGNTIDFFVSEYRDKDAAKKFFKKALKALHNQQPRVITTDKYVATEIAIYELIYDGSISVKTTMRKIKYLNNIIEQDHRFIKRKVRPILGFNSLETAEKTICGIEIMHMIRKGQVEEIQSALSEVEFINKIMGITA